jgi:hypothetical protein
VFEESRGHLCFIENSVPLSPTLKMATAASPETLVTIYRTTCCHIQERRSFLLWELQIWYIFIISYASSLCTFQQFSLILSSQTVLLVLTPPKQNLMLVSSIPVYISISSHYITTPGILIPTCRMSYDKLYKYG